MRQREGMGAMYAESADGGERRFRHSESEFPELTPSPAAPALYGISLRRAVNFRYAPKSKLIESWESEKDGEI